MKRVVPLVEFGRILFRTGDLDPVYLALPGSTNGQGQLYRWLVAYWCFYNAGLASWASEYRGLTFWKELNLAAENRLEAPTGGLWPRGAERRHFRGLSAVKAVGLLHQRYGSRPEGFVEYLAEGPMDVTSVMMRAQTHYLFGSWIAFKMADMLDAVAGFEVGQDDPQAFLYATPRKSIDEWGAFASSKNSAAGDPYVRAMEWLRHELRDCTIPHKPGKLPDYFSLETVWCKHLSHRHGHYPLYKDIREICAGVELWSKISPTAAKFLKAMPPEPAEGLFAS